MTGPVGTIEIRVALPTEADAVSGLLMASYPVLMQGSYPVDVLARALPLMTRANPLLLASGTYYLACSATGQVIGCGGWTSAAPGTADQLAGTGHLRHFAVHPSALRQGVGRRIAEKCIGEAIAASVRRLLVYSSLNAEGFYASLGMRRVRTVDLTLAPGVEIPGILMERVLV